MIGILWRLAGVVLAGVAFTAIARADTVDYLRDVKPILSRHCVLCHGPGRQESGLRLDTADLAKKGGESGPAIEPGNDHSLLLRAVRGEPDATRMPADGDPLSKAEIAILAIWIRAGAQAPAETPPALASDHWAFRPPVAAEIPASGAGSSNPIDAFLAAYRTKTGLVSRPPADRDTLLRRVTIDLLGIPPSPAEMEAFRADTSPDAFFRVVDRLLASPRHGERWGRQWMDVWRYSDWYGWLEEVRFSQRHIWHWRDWIIESINRDVSYRQMVVEMLAGDEVAPCDPSVLRATGYLARSWYRYNRNTWLQDTVEHTGKAFLGLTIHCARCHDHMYDPIRQEDYYRFRAFFEPYDVRTDRVGGEDDLLKAGLPRAYDKELSPATYLFVRGDDARPRKEAPLAPGLPPVLAKEPLAISRISLPPLAHQAGLDPQYRRVLIERAEQAAKAAEAAMRKDPGDKAALARLESATAHRTALLLRMAADDTRASRAPSAAALSSEACRAGRREALATTRADLVEAEAAIAKLSTNPPDDKGKKQRAALQKRIEEARTRLGALEKDAKAPEQYQPLGEIYPGESTGRRTALARWIVDRKNPLAARVLVNHVWLRHFGAPLVPTVFDFGRNGKPPTHPELLDWLAVWFMDHDWSMKKLHRLIVTSSAYSMDSAPDPANLAKDPDNKGYWRMSVRRMEAETVRDSLLFISGQLDFAMGGPELDHQAGEKNPRRSIYFRHAQEKQMSFLRQFDLAAVTECYQRPTTVMPQQALALANSDLAASASRSLAQRLVAESAFRDPIWSDEVFIDRAVRQILGRSPTGEERTLCQAFLHEQARRHADVPAGASGKPALARPREPNARARENLVHVLLNHNDFVTIR